MPTNQVSDTQWTFTGRHTTGAINRTRDGLVTRYIAKNSHGQQSPMLSSPERASRWLQANDTARG